MENFIEKAEKWIELYESNLQKDMISRRDLKLKYHSLRKDFEKLGDIRPFVRDIFWEVTRRYLIMPEVKEIKQVSFSIKGIRD